MFHGSGAYQGAHHGTSRFGLTLDTDKMDAYLLPESAFSRLRHSNFSAETEETAETMLHQQLTLTTFCTKKKQVKRGPRSPGGLLLLR